MKLEYIQAQKKLIKEDHQWRENIGLEERMLIATNISTDTPNPENADKEEQKQD